MASNESVKFYIGRMQQVFCELVSCKRALVELYANEIYEELKGKPHVNLTEYVIAKSNDTGLYDAIRGLEHEFSLDINELTFAIELAVGARLNADKQQK